MTKDECAQRIIIACHQAQNGGQPIYGIHGLQTWTGMSHSQVWKGLDRLRDAATAFGTDLISMTNRVYRVGDTDACREWLVNRMKYISTAVRRVEEMSTAVANVTGDTRDRGAARQAVRVVTEADQLVADLLLAKGTP